MATRNLILAIPLVFAACGDVEPLGSGAMQLQWEVNPNGCESSGVEQVEIHASGPHAFVERYDCGLGAATLAEMTPGLYRVELRGFDSTQKATFESVPLSIEVEADEVAQPLPVRLQATPAEVDVRWTFDNGRVCGANEARWIGAVVFDEFDYEVAAAHFGCDLGQGALPPLRAGNYVVEVSAYQDDVVTWRGTAPLKVTRADSATIDVSLSPTE